MRTLLRLVALVCVLSTLVLTAKSALAVLPPTYVELVVDTTADSNDVAHQACTSEDSDCSLRGAVSRANAGSSSGVVYRITLPTGEYLLTISGEREDANATGDLDVTGGIVSILGAGASTTVIDGNKLDRVLHVLDGAILEMHNVTITGGETGAIASVPGASGAPGGGIYSAGGLILRDCIVDGNATAYGYSGGQMAHGGHGGGIYNVGSLLLENTTVSNNRTGAGSSGSVPAGYGGDGGGLYSENVASLINSGVISNTTGPGGTVPPSVNGADGGNGGRGGGIFSSGTLTATGSTIGYNVTGDGGQGSEHGTGGSGGSGGGIFSTGRLALGSGIVSDNATGDGDAAPQGYGGNGGDGGGLFSSGDLTLDGTTISGNVTGNATKAAVNPDSHGGDGGGAYVAGNASVSNAIVDDNRTGDGGEGYETGPVGGNGDRAGHGGGIYNAGALYLDAATITKNTTGKGGYGVSVGGAVGGAGGSGGGIYNAGQLAGQGNAVSDNSTGSGGPADGRNYMGYPGTGTGGHGGDGGGIFNSHAMTLTTITLGGNTTGNGGTGTCVSDQCDAYGGQGGHGGGIYQAASSALTLAHSEITTGHTGVGGGAIIVTGTPYPGDSGYGGGMYVRDSKPTLLHTVISDNIVPNGDGAGLYSESGAPYLLNAEITGNGAFGGGAGGGMYITGTHSTSDTLKLVNVLVNGNHADSYGGGIYSVNNNPELRNVTLAGNVSKWDFGCAMYSAGTGTPVALNTIIWGNVGGDQIDFDDPDAAAPDVQQSIVQGGYGSNSSDDPQFVRNPGPGSDGDWDTWGDNDRGDLHLTGASPAIDAGSNLTVPADVLDLDGDGDLAEPLPYDLDGQDRFTDVPWRTDEGIGTPPLVDMGAYEYAPKAVYLPLTTSN